jgi:hypothetical protein
MTPSSPKTETTPPIADRQQVAAAYLTAAEATGWRPYSDLDDVVTEARQFASAWLKDESKAVFDVGIADRDTRPAVVFLIEAAKAARIGRRDLARDLLDLALIELADARAVTA